MSDWKVLAEKELKGRSIQDIEWETLEGIRVKPLCALDVRYTKFHVIDGAVLVFHVKRLNPPDWWLLQK